MQVLSFEKVPVLTRDAFNENILLDYGCRGEANTQQFIYRNHMALTCSPLHLIGNGVLSYANPHKWIINEYVLAFGIIDDDGFRFLFFAAFLMKSRSQRCHRDK